MAQNGMVQVTAEQRDGQIQVNDAQKMMRKSILKENKEWRERRGMHGTTGGRNRERHRKYRISDSIQLFRWWFVWYCPFVLYDADECVCVITTVNVEIFVILL